MSKEEEKQGWYLPEIDEIIPVGNTKETGHRAKAKERLEKMGIKIGKRDPQMLFIKMGNICFCESCIISTKPLSDYQKKRILKYMKCDQLPPVEIVDENEKGDINNGR